MARFTIFALFIVTQEELKFKDSCCYLVTGIHFKEMKAVANRQTEVGSISIQQYLKETTFIKHGTFESLLSTCI